VITHPTAAELAQALAGIETGPEGLWPSDARAAFIARVADNARATLEREAALGPPAEAAAVERLRALLGVDRDFETLNASSAHDCGRASGSAGSGGVGAS
jgi:hypothetical protein